MVMNIEELQSETQSDDEPSAISTPSMPPTLAAFTQKLQSILNDVSMLMEKYISDDETPIIPAKTLVKQMKKRFSEASKLADIGISNERILSVFVIAKSMHEKDYQNYISELIPPYRHFIETLKTFFQKPNSIFHTIHLYKTWTLSHQTLLELFKKDPNAPNALVEHYPLIYLEMAQCCIESVSLQHSHILPDDPFCSYLSSMMMGVFDRIKFYFELHNQISHRLTVGEEQYKTLQEKYDALAVKQRQYSDKKETQDIQFLKVLSALNTFDLLFAKLKWMVELLLDKIHEASSFPFLATMHDAPYSELLITITQLQGLFTDLVPEIKTLKHHTNGFLKTQLKESQILSVLKEYRRICYRSLILLNDKKVALQLSGSYIVLPSDASDDTKETKENIKFPSDAHWENLSTQGSTLIQKCQKLLATNNGQYQTYVDLLKELDLFSADIGTQSKAHPFDTKKVKVLTKLIKDMRSKIAEKAITKQAHVDTLMKTISNSQTKTSQLTNHPNGKTEKGINHANHKKKKLAKARIKQEKKAKAEKEKSKPQSQPLPPPPSNPPPKLSHTTAAAAAAAIIPVQGRVNSIPQQGHIHSQADPSSYDTLQRITTLQLAENAQIIDPREIKTLKESNQQVSSPLLVPQYHKHNHPHQYSKPEYIKTIQALIDQAYAAINMSRNCIHQFNWVFWEKARIAFKTAHTIAKENDNTEWTVSVFKRYFQHLMFGLDYAKNKLQQTPNNTNLQATISVISHEIQEITGMLQNPPRQRPMTGGVKSRY